MSTNIEKSIDALNKLLEINNDRHEGYEKALGETTEHELKILFADLARTSHKNIIELSDEISRLGGKPTEGTKVSGKFFRAWMDVKAALTGKDRKAILSSCEFGEDNAVDTYEKVIKNDFQYFTFDQGLMVKEQFALIQADHDKVRSLRDSASFRKGRPGEENWGTRASV